MYGCTQVIRQGVIVGNDLRYRAPFLLMNKFESTELRAEHIRILCLPTARSATSRDCDNVLADRGTSKNGVDANVVKAAAALLNEFRFNLCRINSSTNVMCEDLTEVQVWECFESARSRSSPSDGLLVRNMKGSFFGPVVVDAPSSASSLSELVELSESDDSLASAFPQAHFDPALLDPALFLCLLRIGFPGSRWRICVVRRGVFLVLFDILASDI